MYQATFQCGPYNVFFLNVVFAHENLKKQPSKVVIPEQIHKMTIVFTQNGQKLLFLVKVVFILLICSASATIIYFSAWDKSCHLSDEQANTWTDVDHLILHSIYILE